VPDWLGFALLVAVVGGVFWLLRLVRRSREGDPYKRGSDSSPPADSE
jgi:hypothetical protein